MIPGWLATFLPERYRDQILGDLIEARDERIARGGSVWVGRVWLVGQVLIAAVSSRWHGRHAAATYESRGGGGVVAGWSEFVRDMKFAIRGLWRAPLFTSVALATLAGGTGLTLTMFTVVNGVLLRPLDYPEPERLVLLRGEPGSRYGVSMPQHIRFTEDNPLIESASAWQGWIPVREREDGYPERVRGASVSAAFFDAAGVRPEVGRFFTAEDGEPGHAPTIVIGHGMWQRDFGGDSGVIGRVLDLEGDAYQIVGVAPRGFIDPVSRGLGFTPPEVWRAHPPRFDSAAVNPGWVGFWSVARIRDAALVGDLTAHMRTTTLELAQEAGVDAQTYVRELGAMTIKNAVVEEVRPTLYVLLAAVVFVLLIACANLGNLLLSRATVRSHEVAIRSSLGAARSRIVRQMLTESVVLAAVGTGIGLLLAAAATPGLVALAGTLLPRASDIAIDGTVVAVAVASVVVTALLFGLLPAFRLSSFDVASRLRDAGRGGGGSGRNMRLRNSLVIVETALALVLLAGAGLLFRSLVGLQAVDLGFETTGAAVAPVTFAQERYASPDAQNAAVRAVTDELASLSSVSAVGGITDMPLSGAVNSTRILRAGESGEDAPDRPNVLVRAITPDFLTAMGVGISAGRSLDSGDAVGAEEVAVVNEEFTRRFFGTEEAVGQLVVVRGVTRRVVGVAADVREFDLTSGGRDAVLYTPYAQEREGWMRGRLWFVMRGSSGRDLSALQSTLQSTLSTVAPAAIVGAPRTLESYVEAHMQAPRLRTTLILVFAALAVLMTAVGTGGVVAYNVSRRVPELGLRMALGAERSDVQRLVLKQTSRLAFGGVLVGLVLALGSMRVLSGFLFGIPAWDPLTLTATAAMLLLVATLSGWVPARRASRIDPATTLRDD